MKASSDQNRKETLLNPRNSPPCTALAQDRRGSLRLSSPPESSRALYRRAQLRASGLQPSAFLSGMLLLVPSDRSGFPQPTLEEDSTIGLLRHRRRVLSAISGRPL